MAEKPKVENIIGEDSSARKIETPPPIEPEPKAKPGEVLRTDEIFERGLKAGLELSGKHKKVDEPPAPPKPIDPPEPKPKRKTDCFGFGIEK